MINDQRPACASAIASPQKNSATQRGSAHRLASLKPHHGFVAATGPLPAQKSRQQPEDHATVRPDTPHQDQSPGIVCAASFAQLAISLECAHSLKATPGICSGGAGRAAGYSSQARPQAKVGDAIRDLLRTIDPGSIFQPRQCRSRSVAPKSASTKPDICRRSTQVSCTIRSSSSNVSEQHWNLRKLAAWLSLQWLPIDHGITTNLNIEYIVFQHCAIT